MNLALWLVMLASAEKVNGVVRERGNGAPLPDVEVLAADRSARATTDADGRFLIDIEPGVAVLFLSPSHVPWDGVPDPTERLWVVHLVPVAGDAEIVVEARRDDPMVSQQRLDRERVLKTPGTFEDPVRLVQSLPGVASTPEYSPKAGDISVRGSLPGENRFYLDTVELPYLYHYNDYASVFHTRLLEDLSLYPSTFGPTWGDTLGGIVDTRSVWEPPRGVSGSVNLNLVISGAELAVPVSDRWTVRASARRSYLDLIESDNEQYTVFPVFWDYFSRVEYRPTVGATWGLFVFGAGDHYTRYAGEPTLLDPYEQSINPSFLYERRFHVVGVAHQHRDNRLRLDGSLSATLYDTSGTLPSASESRREQRLALKEVGVIELSEHFGLGFGGDARLVAAHLRSQTERVWPEVKRETTLIPYGQEVDSETTRLTAGIYAEGRWQPSRLALYPSLRIDADSLSRAAVFDPRLSARYSLADDTRIRAGAGIYSAFAPTLYVGVLGVEDLPPAHSYQVATGFDHAFAGRLEVALDGWLSRTDQLWARRLDGTVATGVYARGQGFELTSRYRLREKFFAWVALSTMRTEREVDGVWAPGEYDQPFAGSFVGSWDFAAHWNVGLRYRVSSGLPDTPIVDGVYDATTDSYVPVYGALWSERLPTYQKVDAHLERRLNFNSWNLTLYAEAWWVPAVSNVMYQAWRYDYDQVEAVHGPGFVPLVGARGEL